MVDVKFGRNHPNPRATHPRLTLDNYMSFGTILPTPTVQIDRQTAVSAWPMYGNDVLGDCTCAAVGHIIQSLTAYSGTEVTVPESDVISLYETQGYVPGNPSTDQGAVIQNVLQEWHDHPEIMGGHTISQFAELRNFYTVSNLKEALYLFGTVYLGINVPQSAMDQFDAGKPWSYVGDNNIIGGHAIPLQKVYAPGIDGIYSVITWGRPQRMTRGFIHNYVEEAWVVISPDLFESNQESPQGFNLSQLQADFAALA